MGTSNRKQLTVHEQDAKRAGLKYISAEAPGYSRKRSGKGFACYDADGRPVKDNDTIKRIKSLVIPPAWQNVWICANPQGHLQATGIDAKGRKQYRYHPDWANTRNTNKFYRLQDFARALPGIRSQVDKDMARRDTGLQKVAATVIKLMEMAYIRVGNSAYARQNGSYGLTTMRDRHVQIEGSHIRFAFKGKSGVMHDLKLKDRRLAHIIKKCRDIPGYTLFQYYDEEGKRHNIGSGDINAYLKEISGTDFTAKDFRTWAGTRIAFSRLWKMELPETSTALKAELVETVKLVSHSLGNTPAVCRKYYIHPALMESCEDGRLKDFYRNCRKKRNKFESEEEFEECMLIEFLSKA